MERQHQDDGVRQWHGDDITLIQDNIYKALEGGLLGGLDNNILSGCTITPNGSNHDIAKGMVFIDGNILSFEGATNVSLPVYLTKEITDGQTAQYADGGTKPITKNYKAKLNATTTGQSELVVDLLTNTFKLSAPTGSVIIWSSPTIPSGYLECDGSALSRDAYAELFSVIGETYGAGDGTTTFNIPDLRGEFIRGWDHGRGIDPNRSLGSFQGDAIRNITGTVNSATNYSVGHGLSSGALYRSEQNEGGREYATSNAGDKIMFDASRVVPTAHEIRSRNVAMPFIIKL